MSVPPAPVPHLHGTEHAAAAATTATPRRRPRGVLVALALVAAFALLATSCTKNGAAWDSARRVNESRGQRGLAELSLDATLIDKAQAWAERMAATGTVSHSVLTDGAGSDWRTLGENVGWARSIEEMHNMFMGSSAHRSNILAGKYNRIGTGVAESGGRYYVVQVFAG